MCGCDGDDDDLKTIQGAALTKYYHQDAAHYSTAPKRMRVILMKSLSIFDRRIWDESTNITSIL